MTIVLGVNEDAYDPAKHHIISNASCTTNCLAPAAKVVHDGWTIKRGLMNTIHSLHQRPAHPRRRAQGPAPRARGRPEHHPDHDRRGQGARPRHPRPQGQVRRLQPARPDPDRERRRLHRRARAATTTVEELNAAFRAAAAGPMQGILGVSDEPLVSSDFRGDAALARSSTRPRRWSLGGNFVKVIAWYDNEWGYSCRVADLVKLRSPSASSRAGPTERESRDHGQALHPRPGRRPASASSSASTSTCRSRTAGHRRHPHPGGDPDHQVPPRPGRRVILASHLGRPDGKVSDGLRLRPVAERLSASSSAVRPVHRRRPRRRDRGRRPPPAARARPSSSRTCASTPRRRRTTPTSRRRWRPTPTST